MYLGCLQGAEGAWELLVEAKMTSLELHQARTVSRISAGLRPYQDHVADVKHEEQRAPVLALVRLEPVVEIELRGLGP